ncbi:TetR/AcrR family transcriptional regulator [Dorea sp. OM07-5]|nr:TetR/AcrR family transcriptional regulator [Dorea sp. OM07-5]
MTNIYRKAAVKRRRLLLSGSNQEVIKFCVQSKKLKRFYVEFILFFKKILDFQEGCAILYYDAVYSAGKEYLSLNISKKAERTKEIIGICLDCFVEKGLTVTTTTDLCNANNLQNGGIYYYFDTKEEMVLACVEEAISRIEQGAFSIAFEDIKDIANMMDHLGTLADELSPVMRFLVSVCVSQEYGNKVKPYLVQLAGRYPYYTKKIAEILGCTAAEVEPYVHLSILALNNYMIFNERALFLPQIEAAKKGLMQLAKRKG